MIPAPEPPGYQPLEIKMRSERGPVQSQVFSEQLKKPPNACHNQAVSTMQVIEGQVKLAKDLAATKRGQNPA